MNSQRGCGPRCCSCGRFGVADEYTPFGTSLDVEPPDPMMFCHRCAVDAENEIVSNTSPPRIPYWPWRPSAFQRRAAMRLGMIEAGPRSAAWSCLFWPGFVPNDYEVWHDWSAVLHKKE